MFGYKVCVYEEHARLARRLVGVESAEGDVELRLQAHDAPVEHVDGGLQLLDQQLGAGDALLKLNSFWEGNDPGWREQHIRLVRIGHEVDCKRFVNFLHKQLSNFGRRIEAEPPKLQIETAAGQSQHAGGLGDIAARRVQR